MQLRTIWLGTPIRRLYAAITDTDLSCALLALCVQLAYNHRMAADVLYARTNPALKLAVDAYALNRGLKMNAAVIDLVQRGLAAAAEEDTTRARLEHLEAERAALTAKLSGFQNQSQVLTAFLEQTMGPVGVCPSCSHKVTGLDLLRTRCPKCGSALSTLQSTSKPLDGQLVNLIGAAALLAGAVWIASKAEGR